MLVSEEESVLGTNQRLQILTMLGMKQIPAEVESLLEDAQRRSIMANGGVLSRDATAVVIAMCTPKDKRLKPAPGKREDKWARKEAAEAAAEAAGVSGGSAG